jgi:Phosphopantetheine attachment site
MISKHYLPQSEAMTEPATESRNQWECALTEIFAQLLRKPSIGTRESFFALGGTSLLAVQMMARVRHISGVALPLWVVLQTPWVEALAEYITSALKADVSSAGCQVSEGQL